MFKIALKVVGIALIFFALLFVLNLTDLWFTQYFKPKRENINREVFENTKSYVHGVTRDLGKYYEEYKDADENGRKAIKAVIKMRFPEFDASKLSNKTLRNFLIEMRGY